MTTAVMTEEARQPGAPAPTPTRAEGATGKLSFDGVLKGEWIKLLSLRSIRWSIATMLVLSWGGAVLMSWSMTSSGFYETAQIPSLLVQSASLGSIFTVLIMGVIGVLAITSEYASGLILSSLTAVPARTPLLVAKMLVVAALALVVGAISTFGSAFIAAIYFGADGWAVLFQSDVMVSLLGTTFYLMLAALMSLGIGALLRSSAGAISVVVTLLFVVTIVFQILMMTGWEWVPVVGSWMPADLGNTVSFVALQPAMTSGEVGYWGALGGLAAWAAAALIPAAILLKTRDAA